MRRESENIIDKLISSTVLAALMLSPWAYGTVEPWSLLIFELGAALILFLWALKFTAEKSVAIHITAPLLIGAAFCAYVALQIVPLFHTETGTLSIAPHATRIALLKLSALLVYFFALIQISSNEVQRARLIKGIVFVGFALGMFGILQHLTWNGQIYWQREVRGSGNCFGPFVNRNHFAGYMAMVVSLTLGIAASTGMETGKRYAYGFAAAVMAASATLSLSRGGFIGMLVGIMVVSVFQFSFNSAKEFEESVGSNRLSKKFSIASLLVFAFCISIGLVLWLGAEPVETRLATLAAGEGAIPLSDRSRIWSDAWRLFKLYPIFGVGLGAYPYISTLTADSPLPLNYSVQQTHNDYLQVLTDAGLIGGLTAALFTASILIALGRRLKEVYADDLPVSAGAGAGIVAMLVHSSVDFNLQIASNALLFLALTALAAKPAGKTVHGGFKHEYKTENPILDHGALSHSLLRRG